MTQMQLDEIERRKQEEDGGEGEQPSYEPIEENGLKNVSFFSPERRQRRQSLIDAVRKGHRVD